MSPHIPRWQQQLIDRRTRKAKLANCPECRHPVLTGLDGDVCAYDAIADPSRLSTAGELAAALIAKRPTYLVYDGELFHRLDFEHGTPSEYPIVASHRCHDPLPTAWLAPVAARASPAKGDDDAPPF